MLTGSIPPTGLPLPFISSGSTSIVVFMSAIGVLLNINKQNEQTILKNNLFDSKVNFRSLKTSKLAR